MYKMRKRSTQILTCTPNPSASCVTIEKLAPSAKECCLKAPQPYLQSGLSDVAWKLKRTHADELNTVRLTGKVPLNLYSVLLVWRSQVVFESKSMEGLHVILQTMARVAPSMGHSLASDRMQIKLGDPISAYECCELHHVTKQAMATDAQLTRFVPTSYDLPAEIKFVPCEHSDIRLQHRASGFATPAQRIMIRTAATAYCFGSAISEEWCVGEVLYIVAWTYFSTRKLALFKVSSSSSRIAMIEHF